VSFVKDEQIEFAQTPRVRFADRDSMSGVGHYALSEERRGHGFSVVTGFVPRPATAIKVLQLPGIRARRASARVVAMANDVEHAVVAEVGLELGLETFGDCAGESSGFHQHADGLIDEGLATAWRHA